MRRFFLCASAFSVRKSHKKQERIGLLGGTFDPLHNGHLAVAETVLARLHLDRLLFIPAARPPHKTDYLITSFKHRATMLERVLAVFSSYELCPIEEGRPGLSYSIDTLRELHAIHARAIFFFITGLDAFAEIHTWKEWDHLPDLTSLVVINRPSHQGDRMSELINRFFPAYKEEDPGVWSAGTGGKIYSLSMEPLAISSTEIRARIQTGKPVAGQIPPTVEAYIREQSLYGITES